MRCSPLSRARAAPDSSAAATLQASTSRQLEQLVNGSADIEAELCSSPAARRQRDSTSRSPSTTINKALGNVGVDDQAGRSLARVRGPRIARGGARRRRAHGARARCRHRVRARREPGVHAAKARQVRRRVREGAVQGFVLELSRRDDGAVRPRSLPDHHSLESWGDAEPVEGHARAPAADDGSGVQHARHGATCCIAAMRRMPARRRRRRRRRKFAGRLSRVDHRRVRRRRRRDHQGAPEGHDERLVARARRAPKAVACQDAPALPHRGLLPPRLPRRRCSATAAARTSRGCRNCRIRSRRSRGRRSSRCIRRPRRSSASKRANSRRSKTKQGSVTAPVYLVHRHSSGHDRDSDRDGSRTHGRTAATRMAAA